MHIKKFFFVGLPSVKLVFYKQVLDYTNEIFQYIICSIDIDRTYFWEGLPPEWNLLVEKIRKS